MEKFDAWFYEVEQFGVRAERLQAELGTDDVKYLLVKEWLKAAYLVGKEEGDQIADYNAELRECVKELFDKYLNRREESDSGRMFAPVQVSSVRVMLTEPLGELLEKMRALSGAERPTPYNPDDY